MDKMKQWVALTGVGVLVVMVAGWMFLVSPKHSQANDLRTQAAGVQTQIDDLQSKLQVLQSQRKEMPQYQAKLAKISTQIPNNPALPGLIRGLSAAADTANVELVSVAPATPTAYTPPTGTAVAAPAAVVAPAGGAAGSTPAVTRPAASALQVITLNLNVVGDYFATEQFFDQLENMQRALKVTGFQMAPGTNPLTPTTASSASTAAQDGRTLTTTITASVFMSPSVAPAAAAVAPVK